MQQIRGRASLAVLVVLGMLFLAQGASAKTLLWMDVFDLAGSNDRAVELAVEDPRVFVVGSGTNAAGNTDFLVRAYDVATGILLWSDQFDLAGLEDAAAAVAVDSGRVFVAGKATNLPGAGGANFVVRAYDAAGGGLLWMDQFDLYGGYDEALTIVAQAGTVFAAGSGWNGAGRKHDFLVRSYDATGWVLWTDAFDLAGESDQAVALMVDGWQLFAVGRGTNAGGNYDVVVRAYWAWGGWLFWMDQYDLAGGFDDALGVATQGGVVAVAGRAMPAPGTLNFLVRAYDAWSGALLWMDQIKHGDASAIVMSGNRVFAAGSVAKTPASYFDGLVRAYDSVTGTVLWTDVYDYFGGHDNVFALAVDKGRLVAGGMSGNPVAPANNQYVVRAYDPWSGGLFWEEAFDLAKQNDWALTVALDGGRTFTAGVGTSRKLSEDFLVRVYER